MDTFRCGTIASVQSRRPVLIDPTEKGEVNIFTNSQFFPAPDGSWVMVDYMETGNWYVCY